MLNILEGVEGYQLLCANCNWIKRWDNKEQPFRETRGTDIVLHEVDSIRALTMFVGGETMEFIQKELNGNRDEVVDALKKAADKFDLDWVEIAWVRRAQLRRPTLQFKAQEKTLERIRKIEREIAAFCASNHEAVEDAAAGEN